MLTNNGTGASSPFNLFELPNIAMNMVENFCSVIVRPVELILRPWHGSRYFTVVVIFLCNAMMIILPLFTSLASAAISMIPFAHPMAPIGMFDIDSFAKLYFILSILHGIRIYRLMIHMENEEHSQFEGPPLPFFHLLPKSGGFWFTRIVLEPIFVFVAATVLGHMFILQSGLVTFLQFSAMALAMKNFIGWYRAWEYIRNIIDARFAGPIIAKLAADTATEADLAPIHMASFPKNVPDDIRRAAISHIARVYSPESDTPAQ
jgi:hypothetical protein